MSEEELDDVDQRLSELESRINEAGALCHDRTVIRLAKEGRRVAKQEHRLMPYLSFSFHLINHAADVQVMKDGCDTAVEMIALLEDEDRARQFQPDLPLEEYEYSKWWHTGFAYKTLATLTGHSQGYNSEGMHQCISDGMNVCRRTGNIRDTLHFREFAVEVYRSADDLEMALHFARGSLQLQGPEDSNRKVASADDIASILRLQGKLTSAAEMVELGWKHCQEFHNPYLAKLNFLPLAREIASLAGRQDLLDMLPIIVCADEETDLPDERILRIPTEDECPYFKFLRDQSLSAEVACAGDFEQAIQLLQPWDRRLYQQQCLTRWFGVRCRIVAATRLAGKMQQARALAAPCQEAAKKAHDWLTLRQLSRLLDESIPATPLALVGDADCGPFASESSSQRCGEDPTKTEPESTTVEKRSMAQMDAVEHSPQPAAAADSAPASPLRQVISEIHERLKSSGGTPEELAAFVDQLMQIAPATVTDPEEAEHLLQLSRLLVDPARTRTVLQWIEAIAAQFPSDAGVLSMFATVGLQLRAVSDADPDELMSLARIEQIFRQSLDLDVDSGKNFARAGLHYLGQENYGEAERCLARAFRLNRTASVVASSLAEVYSLTERPRDALAVLDMALREGASDPQLAWQAALRAMGLEQFDAVIAYLDRFEQQQPDQPWANHYRAFALLELKRPMEALSALDREAVCNPDADYHIHLQRAGALSQLGRVAELRELLATVLSIPMTSVTYLSPAGLQRLLQRVWMSSFAMKNDDPLRRLLQDHLVSTGLAMDGFFDSIRCPADLASGPTAAKVDAGSRDSESTSDTAARSQVQFYRVKIHQPLDDGWRTLRGCLAGEEDWVSYDNWWGVLASDEAEARDRVLDWQQRCYPLPPQIRDVESGNETFDDVPGIVWQGQREGQSVPG